MKTIAANWVMQRKSRRGPVQGHDEEEQPPVAVAIFGVLLREPLDLEILPREGANHAYSREILLQRGRHEPLGFIRLFERSLHFAEKNDREQDDDERIKAPWRAAPIFQSIQRRIGSPIPMRRDALPQSGSPVRGDRTGAPCRPSRWCKRLHDVAGLDLVVPGHRNVLKMLEKPIAQFPGDGFAGDTRKPALKAGESCRCGGDQRSRNGDDRQRPLDAPLLAVAGEKPG